MSDDLYAIKEIFVVVYRINTYSIYRLPVQKSTRYQWVISDKESFYEAIGGEPRSDYFPARIDKRRYDWFLTLAEAKKFTINKLEAMIGRMYAKIDVLDGILSELRK